MRDPRLLSNLAGSSVGTQGHIEIGQQEILASALYAVLECSLSEALHHEDVSTGHQPTSMRYHCRVRTAEDLT